MINTPQASPVSDFSAHLPVMLGEVINALEPKDGEIYVDGTFGAGGYSQAVLEAADCKLYAIDRDPSAIKRAEEMKRKYKSRFTFMRGCFGDVENLLRQNGCDSPVDGFVLDIGVSSMQIDQPARGFSFRHDGPLDMRMDSNDETAQSAADMVNTIPEKQLADLIYKYGQERLSRRIAKAIVARRKEMLFTGTHDLAECVRSAMPKRKGEKIDPATRTFQALRIAVNDELGELSRALLASENILSGAGRLVVVSFHSLEDTIVKNYLKEKSAHTPRASRHSPGQICPSPIEEPLYTLPKRNKSVKASDEEISQNPRSRSARLRYAIRRAEK